MPYFNGSSILLVIAIKNVSSIVHSRACLRVSIVSSVVNDFEETIKIVSLGSNDLILEVNSTGSDPVIN